MKKLIENKWFAIGLIVVATFGVYANSFKNEFVYDDKKVIVENEFIKSWENLPKLLTKKYFVLAHELSYRPVCTISYFIDYSIWKLNVFGWHLTNISFHTLNAILVYLIASFILKSNLASLICALLFALHPIQTEAVNGISFREDLISFFFFLLAFYFYVKESPIAYLLSLIFFIFALFSKEMAITLPVILMNYDICFVHNREKIKNQLLYYSSFFIVGIGYLIFKFFLFKPPLEAVIGTTAFSTLNSNFYQTMLTMSKVFVGYIKLLFLPYKLSIEHLVVPVISVFNLSVIISIGIIAFILVFAIKTYKKSKEISFSIFYFFISILPVSNIVPFGAFMAERYLYFSTFGFCILLTIFIIKKNGHNILILVLFFLLSVYSIKTILRNREWENGITLWTAAVKLYPNSEKAHNGLGCGYKNKKLYTHAIKEFRKAIGINPFYVSPYKNLGVIFEEQNLYEDAISEYKKALKVYKYDADSYYGIGTNLTKMGNYENVIEWYKKALIIKPNFISARYALAGVYKKMGLYKNAIAEYKKVIELDQTYIHTYINLGDIYEELHLYENALAEYNKALLINPKFADAYNNIGICYSSQGLYDNAIKSFLKAVEIDPENGGAYYNLSICLLNKKNYKESQKYLSLAKKYGIKK